MYIFQENGWPSPQHIYIFNGDYTDRGDYSIQNFIALIAFKLYCPSCIHFTRGNHETEYFLKKKVRSQIIKSYGNNVTEQLGSETNTESDHDVYDLFLEVIHQIPFAIILQEKILVMHAGIHNPNLTIEDIRSIERGVEPESDTIMDEILWADPMDKNGTYYEPNRGTNFGPDVSKAFLKNNNLDMIVRGHTQNKDGYMIDHDGRVITIWSSPNSPGRYEKGAYLNIDANLNLTIGEFDIHPTLNHIEDWSAL